jgi:protein TonB
MRQLLRQLLLVLYAFLVLSCVVLAEDGGRRIIKKVAPVYPQMAKQYQVSGAVKLEVTVAADGSVRSAKVIAGHPMLTSAAVDAVSHWRYEQGAEVVETVVVNFGK